MVCLKSPCTGQQCYMVMSTILIKNQVMITANLRLFIFLVPFFFWRAGNE
jgi:hypothetical protein